MHRFALAALFAITALTATVAPRTAHATDNDGYFKRPWGLPLPPSQPNPYPRY